MNRYKHLLKLNNKTRLDPLKEKLEKSSPVMKIVVNGLLTAIVFLFTFVFSFIKIEGQGYFNLGDFVILCFSFTFGWAYTIFPAIIGSALADIVSGNIVYVPATIMIKAIIVFCGIKNKLWILTFLLGEIWMFGMYYLWDISIVFHGDAPAAYQDLLINTLQASICFVLSIIYAASIIIWKEKESPH